MEQNLRFGLVLGRLAVLKPLQINLKYATFEGNFYVFMREKSKINSKIIVAYS